MKNVRDFNIKNFPINLHREAKAAAALQGMSLKDFVITALNKHLEEFKTKKQ